MDTTIWRRNRERKTYLIAYEFIFYFFFYRLPTRYYIFTYFARSCVNRIQHRNRSTSKDHVGNRSMRDFFPRFFFLFFFFRPFDAFLRSNLEIRFFYCLCIAWLDYHLLWSSLKSYIYAQLYYSTVILINDFHTIAIIYYSAKYVGETNVKFLKKENFKR